MDHLLESSAMSPVPASSTLQPYTTRYQRLLSGFLLLILSCLISLPALSETAAASLEQEASALLEEGSRLIQAGRPQDALNYFNQVITRYEAAYPDKKTRFYGARTQMETLSYLYLAATEQQAAVVISSNWPYAHYLKAYALIELKEHDQAQAALEQALKLSPQNARFLGEMGHLQQTEQNWILSLRTFERAEEAAEFSPPELQKIEAGRACRGQGYSYIELKQLEKARATYERCLQTDPDDARAKQELDYINILEQKR